MCNAESSRIFSEDFLVQDGAAQDNTGCSTNQDTVNNKKSRVKPLLEVRLPKNTSRRSCWQELNICNMPELLHPPNIFKLVDERGVVVGLQPELIDAISR